MVPIPRGGLEKRMSTSASTYTVIFILVVVVVAFICMFWGYIWPKWRSRHPQRPSPTRFNTASNRDPLIVQGAERHIIRSPCRQFPSHPAVMHHLRKSPSGEGVQIYNPRTETPFANSPPTGEAVSIPSVTPRPSISHGSLRKIAESNGLFSPAKKTPDIYEMSRTTGATTEMAEYGVAVRSADAKEYILALPEPLILQPRSAGRPPPLTKQLEKFPMPISNTSKTKKSGQMRDDVTHPKKLFAKLEEAHQQELAMNGLKWQSRRSETGSDKSSDNNSITTCLPGPNRYGDSRQRARSVDKTSPMSLQIDLSYTPSSHIRRAGTITRPKTPVAEIRDLYDRAAAEVHFKKIQSAETRREHTPFTEPPKSSPTIDSGVHLADTPPTSREITDKHLPLLPTPLHIRRATQRAFSVSPEPGHIRGRSGTPSSVALPESPDKLGPLKKTVRSKRPYRKSIGFYHRNSSKPRPANLSLLRDFYHHSPEDRYNKSRSLSSTSKLLSPMPAKSPARHSFAEGSSVYSRDTKALSVARSPLTPDFPTPTLPRHLVRSVAENPFQDQTPHRPSSLDLIRSKIDDWNLHTDDLLLEPSASITNLKRTASDLGPRSPALPLPNSVFHLESTSQGNFAIVDLGISIPRIFIGRPSDDIFREGQRNLESRQRSTNRGGKVTQSAFSTSDSNLSSIMGRTAPGGAEWI